MKKIFDLRLIIILVVAIALISGCAQTVEKDTPTSTEEMSSENSEIEEDDDELISEQEEPTEPNTHEPSTEETVSILPVVEYDTVTNTGRFSEFIDDTHVVILISGVPEAIAEKVFLVDENIKDKITEIDPSEETVLKFEYYLNSDDVNVIVEVTEI